MDAAFFLMFTNTPYENKHHFTFVRIRSNHTSPYKSKDMINSWEAALQEVFTHMQYVHMYIPMNAYTKAPVCVCMYKCAFS